MKNFQPGGFRNRREDIGGRPRSDVNKYAPKNRKMDGKPSFGKSFGGGKGKFGGNDRGEREQKGFPATCTECGRACDVPFRPDGDKPVFCRDCFAKKNGALSAGAGSRDRFTATEQRGRMTASYQAPVAPQGVSAEKYDLLVQQLSAVESKVNQILELIKASEVLVENLPTLTPDIQTVSVKKAAVKGIKAKVSKAVVATKAPVAKKVAAKKSPAKKVATKKVAKKAAKK